MLEFDPQHHAGLQLNLNVILGHFLDGGRHRRLAQHNPDALIHFQGSGIHFDQRCFDSSGNSLGSGFRLVGFGGNIGLARGRTTWLLGLLFFGVGTTAGKDVLCSL